MDWLSITSPDYIFSANESFALFFNNELAVMR